MNHPKSHPSPILSVDTAPGETPGSADNQSAIHALGSPPRAPGAPGRTDFSNLSGSRGHSAFGGAPSGAPPTELVLEGRLEPTTDDVGWRLRDDECPLEGAHSFDITTGEIVWRPTCKNARCRRCSRQVSAQTFALARRALEPVERVRFITLTRAPDDWDDLRHEVKMWTRRLRREGYTMELLWVVERGDSTGMKHVHGVQHGDYVPKDVLTASWPHGSTFIEGARQATDYLSKGVIRYIAKGIDNDLTIEQHMNMNGGRAAHWSRRFFAGQSRDAYRKSNPLPGIYFVHTYRPLREVAS